MIQEKPVQKQTLGICQAHSLSLVSSIERGVLVIKNDIVVFVSTFSSVLYHQNQIPFNAHLTKTPHSRYKAKISIGAHL